VQLAEQARHYNRVWQIGHVWSPAVWPEWAIVAPLLAHAAHRLEIGAGLRPRLPIAGTCFADLSQIALYALAAHGGRPMLTSAADLPFAADTFDLVAACELLEHLPDDRRVLTEIARVTRPGGYLVLSVPLQQSLWTDHDVQAGHFRRYAPPILLALLSDCGFTVIRFSPQLGEGYIGLKKVGAWALRHAPRFAIWLEDRVTLPIGVRLQRSARRWLPTFPLDTDAPGGCLLCERTVQRNSA